MAFLHSGVASRCGPSLDSVEQGSGQGQTPEVEQTWKGYLISESWYVSFCQLRNHIHRGDKVVLVDQYAMSSNPPVIIIRDYLSYGHQPNHRNSSSLFIHT